MVEARVRNLSESGACIDDPAGLPPEGRVLVTMGTLHHIEGRVRWSHDGRAGLHFPSDRIDIAAARRPRGALAATPQNRAGWLANIQSPYRRGND
ncbi:PilZ domain-containing protein [Sphingomonas hankookensis]|uniref:PilZ domain-containing protein n=1 Tax=Sphingomonas hankookensis TaxID=563996 RepID=UPI003D30181D